jgi:hypothetical protein
LYMAGLYAVLLVAIDIWVYQACPFGEYISRVILDLIPVLAALSCAIILSLVVMCYQKGEPPRQVWLNFAISLWLWALGEIIWMAYNLTVGEVPELTLADGCYFAGYIFFTAALASQFRLVFFDQSRKTMQAAGLSWLAVVLSTSVTLLIAKSQSFFVDFLSYFYPFADFAIAVAAVFLVITFQRGLLARPWLSLFLFVFSDGLYVWATASGVYEWQGVGSSFITMLVDLIYVIAYLLMGWGVFQQYLALKFGPASKRITTPMPAPKL